MPNRFWTTLMVTAVFTLTIQTAHSQSTPLQDAQAMMRTGDFAGAADILRPLVEAEPENATAWLSLGTALERSGQPDDAVPAYHEAARFPPTNARALYNLGLLYANNGEPDSAFAYLGQADATGAIT